MPLATLITSVVYTKNKDTDVSFFIIEDGITENNKEKINTMIQPGINITFIKKPNLSNLSVSEEIIANCYITVAMYYRLYSAQILPPEIHRILYLDCDMIVCKDLWELYSTDFEDNYVIAVRDLFEQECCERLQLTQYVNSGMMLVNLDKWREDNLTDQFERVSHNNKKLIKWPDQDIMNMTCTSKIKITDPRWNVQVGTDTDHEPQNILARNAGIIHYITGKKPWVIGALHPFFNEFQKNLAVSPFNEVKIGRVGYLINIIVSKPLAKDIFQGLFPDYSTRKQLFLRFTNRLIEYLMNTNYVPLK